MVGWPASGFRLHSVEAKPSQIELVDEDINCPDGIVLADIVVETLRKQCALRPILTLDESLHQPLPRCDEAILPSNHYTAFSHSLDPKRSLNNPPVRASASRRSTGNNGSHGHQLYRARSFTCPYVCGKLQPQTKT